MARPRQFDTDAALDQAIAAFWERGYDNASVQDLCEAMGIRPASLYGAFGDKHALFIQALSAYMDRSYAGFAQVMQAAGGTEGLRAFFARLIDRLSGAQQGHWGCLVTNSAAELARRDPAVADLVERHWGRLETALAGLLQQARDQGQLRAGAGPDAARMLICVAQGLNVLAKTQPGRPSLEAIAAAALDGLLAPGAGTTDLH